VKRIFITMRALAIGLIGGAVGLFMGYSPVLGLSEFHLKRKPCPQSRLYPVENFNNQYYIIGGFQIS